MEITGAEREEQQRMSSTVYALELGMRLRERREQLGLTATAVGKQTGIGGNNMSSIEIAKRKLTAAKLDELAGIYELSAEELAELADLRERAGKREWWDDYARLYSEEFLRFIGLEAGASAAREYAAETIPGVLQTADYARAMIRAGSPYIKPVDVGPKVESRLARQEQLEGPEATNFTAVIGQTSLLQEVGSRDIMAHQLTRLAKLSEERRDAIHIHVVPYTAGAHPLTGSIVKILDFTSPRIPSHAWFESATMGVLSEKSQVVRELSASFDEAADRALDLDESLEMIHRVRRQMET